MANESSEIRLLKQQMLTLDKEYRDLEFQLLQHTQAGITITRQI